MERRRKIQAAYNEKHHITPKSIIKAEVELKEFEDNSRESSLALIHSESAALPEAKNIPLMIKEIERQMLEAADNLNFELAAELRDRLFDLKEMSLPAGKIHRKKKR